MNERSRLIVAFKTLKVLSYWPPPAQLTLAATPAIEKFSTLPAPAGTKNVTG